MQPDSKAQAEAIALLNCIQVTEDPTEQNRLWNRYYRLSDQVFPEAAALHARYKSLQGAPRQRLKAEYMELVRTLWHAFEPDAAYAVSFTESAKAGPAPPASPASPRSRPPARPRATGGPAYGRIVATLLVLAAMTGGGAYWWTTQAGGISDERDGAAPPVEVAESTPEEARNPSPAALEPVELPPLVEDISEAELEAELARAIQPDFKSVPASLRGKGDRVDAGDTVYEDVHVIESDAQYYVRLPAEGAVETVSKETAAVTLGANPADRKALLALWKENRAAIDEAEERRDAEKRTRLAAHYKAQEAARQARAEAQEAERWRVKGGDWLALSAEQRKAARMRAYSNWQTIQSDVRDMEELYYRIVRGYEIIGITDSRATRLNSAYKRWARQLGPNFEIEDALISYRFGRDEIVTEIAGWEEEYYRLLEHVNEKYPAYEERVEEIKRLDAFLPSQLREAEATIDWDSALEEDDGSFEGGAGTGTGFIVAENHVMTCAHVVRGGNVILATSTNGTQHTATVVTMDSANDWALLKVEGLSAPPVPVASGQPNVGATIYCLGYPLGGIKDSADPIAGSGNIAALQRLDGDQRFMQITAPVNPGNSGGPVLDQYGRWVGIVSQKLNDKHTLESRQTVAQGISFAVKATFIEPILDPRTGVALAQYAGDASAPMSLETIAQTVAPSIVRINVR